MQKKEEKRGRKQVFRIEKKRWASLAAIKNSRKNHLVQKQQNNPLYLETFSPSPSSSAGIVSDAGDDDDEDGGGGDLRFHFAVHAALDAVDERVARSSPSASSSSSSSSSAAAAALAQARARAGGAAPDSGEAYLGVLYPSDEFVIYG